MPLTARTFRVLTVFISIFLVAPGMASMTATAAQDSTAATQSTSTSGLDALGLPELDITITANGFKGVPSSTPAGRYLVTANGGDPYMQVNFLQPTGMSVDDLLQMLQGSPASPAGSESGTPASGNSGANTAPPAFFYDFLIAGGVSILSGKTNQVVLDLKPGDWIAWGGNPDASQQPIAFKVTGDMPADLATPESNATITLSDFAIDISAGKLQSGHNVVKLENTSPQPHFLDLQKGPDGMTKAQVKGALNAEMTGTPVAGRLNPDTDFMPVVSTTTQSAGTTMWITFDLDPGSYGAFCFFPDKDTGMPHAYMGMFNIFTIDK